MYILGGYSTWGGALSTGSTPQGFEYPRPLNRSQEGVLMKFFAAYTGSNEGYNYVNVRNGGLEVYLKVCFFYVNVDLTINNKIHYLAYSIC